MLVPGSVPLRVLLGCLLLLLGAAQARAQTATLRGFVTSASDGQPLPGVNVALQGTDGQLYGHAADSDGFYAISRVPAGTYVLRATFVGFVPYVDTLTLAAGDLVTRNIALADNAAELGEVVVETEVETAGAAANTAGLQTVRPGDIELVPAPDISADLVNYLVTMPGVVTGGDRGGQLFIRGGEPSQNLVLLDGMLVYQPFHLVGFFSAFPSEVLQSADVYAGGYGGRYGGRLSSVIDITTRTGNKQRFAGAVTLAPFVSSARVEGPLWPGKVSALVSVRESVIEQGAARLIDEPLPFTFGDRFAKVHANLSESSQLSVSAISTHDRGRLGLPPEANPGTASEDEVAWTNEAVGGRFLLLPSQLPVLAELLLSYSRLENRFGPRSTPTRTSAVQQVAFASNLTHYVGNLDITWGLFVGTSQLESELGGQFQNLRTDREFVTEAGAYIEPSYRLANGLRVQPGLRIHTFPSKSRTFVEPRLRAVWDAGIHRFSAAAGYYHQEIVGVNDRRDAGDVFTAWTASPLGQVPEAMHVLGGYRIHATNWLDVSVEGFYKKLKGLTVAEWTAFPRFTTRLQRASGQVQGVDVRLEVTRPWFYGFVSYGYARVDYDAPIRAFQLQLGRDAIRYSPPHDRRHQVNVVATTSLYGFDLSARWQLGTGLPFNEALGFDQFILLDSLVDVTDEFGEDRVIYPWPYTGRLPAYHRLDVSIDRSFRVGHALATIQASLINAYDRRNLFYLDLYTLRRVDQLPFVPSLGLKLELL